MIYLDPSAIVALTVRDDRGRELARWLNADAHSVVLTSVLSEVEAASTLRREHPGRVHHLPRTLAAINRYALDDTVRTLAGALASSTTTSVTAAVHVATALIVLGDDTRAFVTFDPGTARAAAARHLPVRTA